MDKKTCEGLSCPFRIQTQRWGPSLAFCSFFLPKQENGASSAPAAPAPAVVPGSAIRTGRSALENGTPPKVRHAVP